ncbi:MAG: RNA-binding transcriptional accessory protein [Deltaproteobacteria bacterium HGW-Deltaproteobacteria-21]|nr:MAG: RNA-binding transcriptional accessory protein [Deltaproteobacteria bacterium HGW-Deltaproteobacteria-21]
MMEQHYDKVAGELQIRLQQVSATARLIEEGCTVPFIARYRKEATGSLDEVAITSIRDRLARLEELERRRESILKSLEERELLSDELKEKILAAETLSTLEDLYLPFRPKRRTRATVAREKGLEPLAALIFAQQEGTDPVAEAAAFVDAEKGVQSAEEAVAGARDIIAEWVNENDEARAKMRALYNERGLFRSRVIQGKEEQGAKYRDYFEWEESAAKAPSHRVLAVRRGEKEGVLDLQLNPPEEEALAILKADFVKGAGPSSMEVEAAVEDCYRRLLSYSMETESRSETKKKADAEAIRVFARNLRELLLAPPLGRKNVLAIDPGIRTGCKITCLDRQGKLLHFETINLFASEATVSAAASRVRALCEEYHAEAVAIGNGTAGRETEAFVRGLGLPGDIPVIMVNESGASVYSASEVARAEFPDLDVSYRGAVSIGRRLTDPLAELVKIDPKSIGVGQYQHDVDQQNLKDSLDDVVVSCVNAVGVEVNTASEQLLTYVSGLGPQLARNMIAFRNENGPFSSREQLKKVPRLGPKTFEQCAGFLRVKGSENPLDASAVHPESYPIVEAMAKDLGCEVSDLLQSDSIRKRIDPSRYITPTVGLPTLTDILSELAKPGRDPRKEFEGPMFTEGVSAIGDLRPGMRLPGVVTNVAAFGAFVDVGVHQDGLVHVSQLADRFVKDPHEVVKVNQKVTVTVLDVDPVRNRISLSMKEQGERMGSKEAREKPVPRSGGKSFEQNRGKPRKPEKPAPFNNPFGKLLGK